MPKLAASVAIGAVFFWLLRRGGLPMVPGKGAFERLAPWAVPAYVLVHCVATFLRTYRWIYLLRPIAPNLGPRRVLGMGFVGFAAVLFAPLRAGEMVRPWLLARDGNVTFLQAAGTVAAERIVDGLILTALLVTNLLIAAPFTDLPDHVGNLPLPVAAVPAAAYGALALFSGAFVAMVLFYYFRTVARALVHRIVGIVSFRLAAWLTEKVERLSDSFGFLVSARHGGAFARDSILYWCSGLFGAWLLLRGSGLPAGWLETCVTLGIMGIGTLIPSGPGFFGSYQLSAYCGLALFFPEADILTAGALFTFVSYTVQLGVTATSGLLGLWLMKTSPAASSPAASTASAPR